MTPADGGDGLAEGIGDGATLEGLTSAFVYFKFMQQQRLRRCPACTLLLAVRESRA